MCAREGPRARNERRVRARSLFVPSVLAATASPSTENATNERARAVAAARPWAIKERDFAL